LIFPNLDSANITYKLLKELNHVDSIGPIMLGMGKPVHIFQLEQVKEMVNMAAIAVIDAQEKQKKKNKHSSNKKKHSLFNRSAFLL
jgi:malate dehydrogenase (oxaloacetate-decarboxylating)(NADP+)